MFYTNIRSGGLKRAFMFDTDNTIKKKIIYKKTTGETTKKITCEDIKLLCDTNGWRLECQVKQQYEN